MRVPIVYPVAVALSLLTASPALASRVRVDSSQVLHYLAAPGERNHVRVAFKFTPIQNDLTGKATITDSVSVTAGAGCTHPDPKRPRSVVCDPIYLGEQLPVLDLGDKNDSLVSNGSDPYVLDGPGDDTITAHSSAVWVNGPGNDIYRGGPGRDNVRRPHGFGADRIYAGAGSDIVYAGPGADLVAGGAGDDYLSGDAGADRISGDAGRDTIRGGPGLDTMFGGTGRDRIDGVLTDFARG